MKKLNDLNWFWSTLIILGFFLLWELLCLATSMPDFILPRPSQFIFVLIDQFHGIQRHGVQTLMTTTTGFAGGVMVGVIIGAIIGSSKVLYNACYPMLVGFYSIPKVALVPVFVVWFGIGTVPAILTSLVICIFPVVVNVATGLATTEPELEDILRALGANKLDILWHVGLPRSLPYFFASPEDRHHAELRRHRRFGNGGRQSRHRQHDGSGKLGLQHAARLRRSVHARFHGDRALCVFRGTRASSDRMGPAQDRVRIRLKQVRSGFLASTADAPSR